MVITLKHGHHIDQVQHIGSDCRNRSEIGQRLEKIKHSGTDFQFHDMTRHKQLRGSHKVLIIFFGILQEKNVLNKVRITNA